MHHTSMSAGSDSPGCLLPPLSHWLILSAPAKARNTYFILRVQPGPRMAQACQLAVPLQAVPLPDTCLRAAPSQRASGRTARGGRRVLRQQQAPGQARERVVPVLRQRGALQLGAQRLVLRQHACAGLGLGLCLGLVRCPVLVQKLGGGAHRL